MQARHERDCDRRANSSASHGPSAAASEGGLCRVRDVLPEVLKRYDMPWPPTVAPAMAIFVGQSTAEPAISAAC
jgi:hypothetical protein